MESLFERRARPRLDPRFTHVSEGRDNVALVGADDWVVIAGMPGEIVKRLDGETSVAELIADLDDVTDAAKVHFYLWQLRDRGYITADTAAPTWREADPRGGVVPGPLGESVPVARRVAEAWIASEQWGVPVPVAPAELGVGESFSELVVASSYLHPLLRAGTASRSPRQQLAVKLTPTESWVGPSLTSSTVCWSCLLNRLADNYPHEALMYAASTRRMRDGGDLEKLAWLPGAIGRVAEALAEEHAKALLRSAAGSIVVIHEDGRHAVHGLPRRLECPDCHPRWTCQVPPPVSIASRTKQSDSQSGYRGTRLAMTYARYRHLISPVTGLVRHLEPVPVEGTDVIHSYTASHPTGTGIRTAAGLGRHARDQSGGKGSTDLEARVSALCEALERSSAVFRGYEPQRIAAFDELGETAIHPNECMLYSTAQYARRRAWNEANPNPFHWVPEPLDRERPVSWTPFWSLVGGGERLVPTGYVYFGFTGCGEEYCLAHTNGLAAGNNLEEAILQGFLELVERDAVALWWYNRTRLPQMDLGSVNDDYIQELLAYYRSIQRDVWVLDLTADLGIPTLAAVSALTGTGREIIMGFGAHLDRRIALWRALTELNQALPHVVQSPRKRRARLLPEFADAIRWWEEATLEAHPYLCPTGQSIDLDCDNHPSNEDLADDIHRCLAIARRHGLDVLVADLTREDIGLSVAKVVVPGLRHFWRRLGPGRLYDVPVTLGRLERPLDEADLNPVPLFL